MKKVDIDILGVLASLDVGLVCEVCGYWGKSEDMYEFETYLDYEDEARAESTYELNCVCDGTCFKEFVEEYKDGHDEDQRELIFIDDKPLDFWDDVIGL